MAATTYTDPGLTVGDTIKAAHIQEIRDSLKAAWSISSQISSDGYASVSYDTASNRITTAGFAYDAAGSQVRALVGGGSVSQRFQYDAANRLVTLKADGNITVLATYTYGSTNERLVAEEGGVRTYSAGEGGTPIAEFTESGASTTPVWSKNYVYLDGRLLATLVPNGSGGESTEYHHPERLGTRVVTNPATGTSYEQVTLPFGTPLNAESTGSNNRRFTSDNRSATTGLDYAVNRHYDPQQGRFTQVDPIGMQSTSLANPQTFNLYAYVANDPVNRTDANGLGLFSFLKKLFKWIVVAFTVAVAVVTIIVAPYLAATVLQEVFMIIGAVTGAIASVANALGFTKLGGILEIISTAATFGASTIGAVLEKTAKAILQAISDGAAFVSKTLSAFGYDKLSQIFDLVSSSTGFVSDSIDDDTGKFKLKKWKLYEFIRGTTEKVAAIAGADKLAAILNKAGLIDDVADIVLGIIHFNDPDPEWHPREDLGAEVKKFGTVVNASKRIQKLLRLQSRLDTLKGLVEKVNSIFDRLEKKEDTATATP